MKDFQMTIHLCPNYHDCPQEPYFWYVLDCTHAPVNCGCGWAATPEQAFLDGYAFWEQYISDNEVKEK